MSFKNILGRRLAKTADRVSAAQHAPPRAIEQLEARVLFSAYIVTGGGDGAASVNKVFGAIYTATTLRAAINAANASPGNDTILMNPFFSGTVNLTPALGALTITDNVDIQGFGASRQAINGGGMSRVFTVAAGVTASINDLTIFNGTFTNAGGGGIRNQGTLTLRRDTIRNNIVINADGAGVWNTGTITVVSSTFSGNNASGGAGGGLFNSGTATVINSTFAGNTAGFGGGIYNADGASIVVDNSTLSGNSAISGGGIASPLNDATVELPGAILNNTIVAGNTFDAVNGLGPDLYGFYSSAGSNNLIGAVGFAKGMNPATNLLGSISNATPAIDAHLSSLGYHGGQTQTFVLLSGSPALGGGNASLIPAGIYTDQRGFLRVVHGKLDIGATQSLAFDLVG